jgi:hypothetical protein
MTQGGHFPEMEQGGEWAEWPLAAWDKRDKREKLIDFFGIAV